VNGWLTRACIAESMHWMVLRQLVELAALTGDVEFIVSDCATYQPPAAGGS
jgi:hypothetical protein